LRMLHLLDPVVYSLEDEDGFRTKILNRQILAEAVASLDPQTFSFFIYISKVFGGFHGT